MRPSRSTARSAAAPPRGRPRATPPAAPDRRPSEPALSHEPTDDALGRALVGAREVFDGGATERLRSAVERNLLGISRTPPAIDRFVVRERVGRGAMGVVYAAYDPVLEREVAVKLVHGDLLGEARALARVAHPNVVAVHEAGTAGGDVFIAMELVRGQDLRRWLAAPRSWREVVDIMVQAARGLGAVHAAGLVHGDFKPENVLVDAAGRVRVADFGLAGDAPAAIGSPPSLAGTPAYMAPEQLAGAPGDPASDQFAFGVTLHEALHGARPFRALGGAAALRPVPPAVRRIVERTLANRPADRYPSMDAVAVELARTRRPARWPRTLAVAAAVAATTATVVAATSQSRDVCRDGRTRVAAAWNDAMRGRVRAALLASGRAHARDTAARVAATLDDYATAWSAAYAGACEATHVRGEQSAALLDRRMQCLDARLADLGALATLVGTAPDPALADRAAAAALALPALAACADRDALLAAVPPPAGPERARVAAARDRLAAAAARFHAGQARPALDVPRAVIADPAAAGHAPLGAEARELAGDAEAALAEYAAAETSYRAAIELATAARDDGRVARAWMKLAVIEGELRRGVERGRELFAHARRAVVRAGAGADLVLERDELEGRLEAAAGDHERARELFTAVLAQRERRFGARHPTLLRTVSQLAAAEESLGHYDAAEALQRRGLALTEALYGPEHPAAAIALGSLGSLADRRGDHDGATEPLARSLALLQAIYGDAHEEVAFARIGLGWNALERGRLADARAELERAAAILERIDARHRELPRVKNDLAIIALRGDDLPRARKLATEAFALAGSDPTQTAEIAVVLAQIAVADDKLAEAATHLERGERVLEAAFGADHPDTATLAMNVGAVLVETGRCAEALPRFERAHAVFSRLGPAHPIVLQAARAIAVCRRRR